MPKAITKCTQFRLTLFSPTKKPALCRPTS